MSKKITIPIMSELFAQGRKPEFLWWVGSAGAFDDRNKKVSRAFAKILTYLGTDFAVLGKEESSSGDVARRAGNEMLFQMQALMNISLLDQYGVTKILTCDPHVYNSFKNEYPDLGGKYEVIHHTQFIAEQIKSGRLKFAGKLSELSITFHDPCYLGRANKEYSSPRFVLNNISTKFIEMKRNKSFALCCGAGGGQMFKEAEKGNKEVFIERTEDALETHANCIATACPYCLVMITDGLKYKNKEEEIKAFDIAELTALALDL